MTDIVEEVARTVAIEIATMWRSRIEPLPNDKHRQVAKVVISKLEEMGWQPPGCPVSSAPAEPARRESPRILLDHILTEVGPIKSTVVGHNVASLAERAGTALANTPDGWRKIDDEAKKLKRVDLCGYYPSTKHGPRLKRIPDCYWHKKAGMWRTDHHDREGFRQLQTNFVITHYREIDVLPQPPEVK